MRRLIQITDGSRARACQLSLPSRPSRLEAPAVPKCSAQHTRLTTRGLGSAGEGRAGPSGRQGPAAQRPSAAADPRERIEDDLGGLWSGIWREGAHATVAGGQTHETRTHFQLHKVASTLVRASFKYQSANLLAARDALAP